MPIDTLATTNLNKSQKTIEAFMSVHNHWKSMLKAKDSHEWLLFASGQGTLVQFFDLGEPFALVVGKA